MIDNGTRAAVLRHKRKGCSNRNIAETLQISRNTVKRIIRSGSAEAPSIRRAKKAQAFRSEIEELVSAEGANLSQVHQQLVARGRCIPYSTLTRYCRLWGLRATSNSEKVSSAKAWISRLMQGRKSHQDLVAELPSPDHIDYLLKKIKTGGLKDRKKACAILGRQKGISNRIIANALHASPKTTRKYYALFAKHGLSELFQAGSVRSRSADEQAKRTKRLLELLHHKPKDFGINRTSWSQVSLAWAYRIRFGEGISRSSVARYIKKAGFAWKKAKRVLTSPDPQYREKLEVVLDLLHSLTNEDLFFFVDELGPLLVKRRGGRSYMHKDEVPSCPRRQVAKGSVTLVGALSATSNQMTWVFGESKDTDSIIELMELLFNLYHDKSKIYITWDAVSWHRSETLAGWLDAFNETTRNTKRGPIIEVAPLPTSSQFLNVIEGVFSGMMRAIVNNSDYQSDEEMKAAMSRHLWERNLFFRENPKRVGKKIWEIDFFLEEDDLRSGNYRDW